MRTTSSGLVATHREGPVWTLDDPLDADRYVGALSQMAAMHRLHRHNRFAPGPDGGAPRVWEAPSAWTPHRWRDGHLEAIRHKSTGEVVRVAPPGYPIGVVDVEDARERIATGGWLPLVAPVAGLVGIRHKLVDHVLRVRRPDEEEPVVDVAVVA